MGHCCKKLNPIATNTMGIITPSQIFTRDFNTGSSIPDKGKNNLYLVKGDMTGTRMVCICICKVGKDETARK